MLTPSGEYFYLHFSDLPVNSKATTHASVARALVASVLDATFGSCRPQTAPFEKYYQGNQILQSGIVGASTDLNPNASSNEQGYLDVHFSSALQAVSKDHLQRYGALLRRIR